jgi:asparagine synthase (glutamine-hydrolysing)
VPGLLGIVDGVDRRGVSGPFEAVCREMARGGRFVTETQVDANERWALGRVHLGALQPSPQLGGDAPVKVLFHGDLHNGAALQARLKQLGEPPADDAAGIVAALYRKEGRKAARSLEGSFCAVVLDEAAGTIVLINDRLGSYPLYWFHAGDRFVFASELRAALKAHPRPELNPRAVADFLKYGFPFGDKTLAAGVDLLPSGSTLAYQWPAGTVSIEPYASIAELYRQADLDERAYQADVEQAFAGAMDRAVAGSHRYGLSLSGGLDTRVMLSALDRLGRSEGVATFTLGGRGCADEVIANQLARMGKTRHTFVALDDHYLNDLQPTVSRMVSLTDGMYLSHGFTEMLALQGFEQSDAAVLLRGHGGELAKASTAWPLHTDQRIFQMSSTTEFITYMQGRLTHVSRGDAAREVLTDRWVDALGGSSAQQSMEESLSGVPLAPPDLCSYLYLKEYHRRVTVPSLEIFRNVAEVRMPLADVDFVQHVLQGPARWRDGVRIHQRLIAANSPKYLKVRNPNTGAPAGAGPLQEAVLDKMNSVLRRLNVYGYRHYHSFDGWMRKAFLDMVDRVVVDPATLERGVYRQSRVKQLVSEAHQGQTQHDDLLQALVIIELWQRQTF